jgi:glycopeptide antibiotics resistance protein
MAALAARRTSTTVTALAIALPLLAALAWLTLAPRRIEQRAPEFVSVALGWMSEVFGSSWGTLGVADFAANLAVFVAIGILAYLIIPRRAWMVAILVGPALSAAVELVQFLLLPERVAALSDIVAAAIGTALGVGLAALCTVITARRG